MRAGAGGPRPGADGVVNPVRVPPWAQAVDLVALSTCGALLAVALFGPVRLHAGAFHLSISSYPRLLIILAIAATARHLVVPYPTLFGRIVAVVSRIRCAATTRAVVPAFVATRLGVVLVGYLAVAMFGFAGGAPPDRVSDSELLNLPYRWDAGWYVGIAAHSYRWSADDAGQQNIAFFPAYPLLMRAGASLMNPRNYPHGLGRVDRSQAQSFYLKHLVAGVAITLGAFAWGLVYVYRLARRVLPPRSARAGVVLLATYPFAVYFSAAYAEGIMLLASAGAFYHAERGEDGAAGFWGVVAGLARPSGFLLTIPLAVLMLGRRAPGGVGRRARLSRALLVALAPVAGLAAYVAYITRLTGDGLAWVTAHAAWGRSFASGAMLDGLGAPVRALVEGGLADYVFTRPFEAVNMVAALFALSVAWPAARRLGAAYGLWIVVALAPALVSGGFMSAGRLTAVLFPVFVYLAACLSRRRCEAVACIFAVTQGLAAALFFTWRPLF